MREEILAWQADTILLDPMWDGGLIGYGTRGPHPVALYSYAALLSCCDGEAWLRASKVAALFEQPYLGDAGPVCCVPLNREAFWRTVEARRLIVLDRLTPLIQGLGQALGCEPHQMVIYGWEPTIELLLRETHTTGTPDELLEHVLSWSDTNITGPWRGPHTPLFLRGGEIK